ncbi:hypothetical protein Y032_0126g1309 [Ancylostoma ceylanicum]|uniref:Peptidase M12A domain-containing protein n=1 Tax=Ancylostoma ceylanicum TaxID=53326 RepID=A0A016T8I5_9BILA|nr:hypothetical protein Y032_0126g1309 [Ancylostoma ceylanicum]
MTPVTENHFGQPYDYGSVMQYNPYSGPTCVVQISQDQRVNILKFTPYFVSATPLPWIASVMHAGPGLPFSKEFMPLNSVDQ